jgi:hypothetical protein
MRLPTLLQGKCQQHVVARGTGSLVATECSREAYQGAAAGSLRGADEHEPAEDQPDSPLLRFDRLRADECSASDRAPHLSRGGSPLNGYPERLRRRWALTSTYDGGVREVGLQTRNPDPGGQTEADRPRGSTAKLSRGGSKRTVAPNYSSALPREPASPLLSLPLRGQPSISRIAHRATLRTPRSWCLRKGLI